MQLCGGCEMASAHGYSFMTNESYMKAQKLSTMAVTAQPLVQKVQWLQCIRKLAIISALLFSLK